MPLLKLKRPRKLGSGAKRGTKKGHLSEKWRYWIMNVVPQILKETEPYPLTIRQIFYRLIVNTKKAKGRFTFKKSEGNYDGLCKHLVQARQANWIEWKRIVDMGRKPTYKEWLGKPTSAKDWWNSWLSNFVDTLKTFNSPMFSNQEYLIEVWSEHEGLTPLFLEALKDYPVTVYFTQGRNSWSNFYQTAIRLKDVKRHIIILHFADADKYGMEMTDDLKEATQFFWFHGESPPITVERVALSNEQVTKWNLPDTQLEAIPITDFIQLIRSAVEKYVDKDKLAETRREIAEKQAQINKWILDANLEGLTRNDE